jgi:hypothetical protein
MSFISFLKKAGTIIADVAETYIGLEPALKQNLPTAAGAPLDKLDLIFNNVLAIEGAFAAAYPTGQTGPQKLVASASLIGPIISSVEAISGKQIGDAAAYTKAVQTITGGIADLMNSLKGSADNSTAAAALSAPAASVTAAAPALSK